jgi:outer membrane protein assembly factor BamE (lipoprotein component of BamABCDE complex)
MQRVMNIVARPCRLATGALLLPLLLMLVLLLCGGCLVTHNSNHSRSGNYVSDATLNQVQPGKTTVSWIRATLGPPTVVEKLEDGTQIWKYNYTERQDSSGTVFIFFAGNDVKETAGTVFIEIKDGIVRRTWRS